MKPRKIIFIASIVSLALIAAGFIMAFGKKTVYPNSKINWSWYTDAKDNGNSEFELLGDKESISFNFKLNKQFPYPYVGITFSPEKPMDISGYDFLHIDVSAEETDRLRFFIKTAIPGFSNPENQLSYAHYSADIPVWDKEGSYVFPMENIEIVSWWYDSAGWDADMIPLEKSFRDVAYFDLQSGESFDMKTPAKVELQRIYFTKNPLPAMVSAIALAALCWLAAGVAILMMKLRTPTYSVFSTDRLIHDSAMEETTSKITAAIAESYGDKSFSMNSLSKMTGLAPSTISRKLNGLCGLTLTKYLTLIRLHEAKRLLTETNITIEDVASRIGFNSRTHFIGLFSKNEGCSPAQYRKAHRE